MGAIKEALTTIVRERKALRQITQKSLAERMGCTPSYISEMLRGDKRISDNMIDKFCDALGVTLMDVALVASKDKAATTAVLNNMPKLQPAVAPALSAARADLDYVYQVNIPAFRILARQLRAARKDCDEANATEAVS